MGVFYCMQIYLDEVYLKDLFKLCPIGACIEDQGRNEGKGHWGGLSPPPAPTHVCLINLGSLEFLSFIQRLQHRVP